MSGPFVSYEQHNQCRCHGGALGVSRQLAHLGDIGGGGGGRLFGGGTSASPIFPPSSINWRKLPGASISIFAQVLLAILSDGLTTVFELAAPGTSVKTPLRSKTNSSEQAAILSFLPPLLSFPSFKCITGQLYLFYIKGILKNEFFKLLAYANGSSTTKTRK